MTSPKEMMLKYVQENSGISTIGDLEDKFYHDIKEDDELVWLIWFDSKKNQIAWKSSRKIFFDDFLDLGNSRKILLQSTRNPLIILTSRMLTLPVTKNPNLSYKKEHWTPCLVLDGNQHRDFIDNNG